MQMTDRQGRFLTALLDDLTAAAPKAGIAARTRLRALHAEGRLDKAEASRAIDVLKRALALATGTAPAPAPRQWVAPAGAPLSAARPTLTVSAPPALDLTREALALEARREAASTLRKGPAKAKGGSRRSGPSIMDSLRSWTPERGAEANAAFARGEVPF